MNPIEVGEPFERIGIDFVGPLERTKKEKQIHISSHRLFNKMARGKGNERSNSKKCCEIYL